MVRLSSSNAFILLASACAGVAVGVALTHPEKRNPGAQKPARDSAIVAMAPLPDDPETIRLAALAGRPSEARAKIRALLETGSPDSEIATWLAPLLIADPDWLETFILTVPEERRIGLVRVTFMEIGNLHPGSVWELLKRSPFAAMAAKKADGTPDYKGLELFWRITETDKTAAVLFDPALGFSDAELARYLRIGGRKLPTARRVLEEWTAGRWAGEAPEFIRDAWYRLNKRDPATLAELEKKTPESLRSYFENYRARTSVTTKTNADGLIVSDPSVEDLRRIGPTEVKNMAEGRAMAARPLPLSTLAKLPPEIRGPAINNYFEWLYPFSEEAASEAISSLDQLDLTPAERQSLLKSAAGLTLQEQGDYRTALELAARMPDATARAEFEKEAWEDWAKQDPEDALSHAATLPEGELKRRVEELVKESTP